MYWGSTILLYLIFIHKIYLHIRKTYPPSDEISSVYFDDESLYEGYEGTEVESPILTLKTERKYEYPTRVFQ